MQIQFVVTYNYAAKEIIACKLKIDYKLCSCSKGMKKNQVGHNWEKTQS
jgi:hypothetical protein